MTKPPSLRFLLLQVRNPDDPMRRQEVECFACALDCAPSNIQPLDIIESFPSTTTLAQHDAVLLGGSGDYSAAGQGDWLERILDGLRLLVDLGKPTFASCWGFQALARAIGGECRHDPQHAELGATPLRLTSAGTSDPLFSTLPQEFLALSGHEDHVTRLPSDAILLASSDLVAEQAYTLPGKPIYATQFHPELTPERFMQRLRAYPRYIEQIAGVPVDVFEDRLKPTPEANGLLRRFVDVAFA